VFREVEDHPLHCPHWTFLLHAGLARTHPGSVNTDPGFFWWLGADHPDKQARTALAVAEADFSASQEKMTIPGGLRFVEHDVMVCEVVGERMPKTPHVHRHGS